MVLSPFGGLFQPCWSRSGGVVPFRMECVALDVERAFDLQAGLGGRRGNQLDHGHAIDEGAPAPCLRDVAEQAMLDLIPLRGARRIMMDMDREAGLVGEFCTSTFH